MKPVFVATALCALFAVSAEAQSVDRTALDGEARQFSALTAIKSTCQNANAPLINSAIDAIVQKAWQRYGKPEFDAVLTTEIPRRRAEVDATGPEDWCRYQRGYLRDLGLKDAFVR
jgi:hypothetical protein